MLTITANKDDGTSVQFEAQVRLDTPVEVEYYRNGGILQLYKAISKIRRHLEA